MGRNLSDEQKEALTEAAMRGYHRHEFNAAMGYHFAKRQVAPLGLGLPANDRAAQPVFTQPDRKVERA